MTFPNYLGLSFIKTKTAKHKVTCTTAWRWIFLVLYKKGILLKKNKRSICTTGFKQVWSFGNLDALEMHVSNMTQ